MKTYEIHSRTERARPAAVMTAALPVAGIGPWLARAYGTLVGVIAAQGAHPAGPPFARYHRLGSGEFTVEAGFPVSTAIGADGDVRPAELPGGPVAAMLHVGPYDEMAAAYEALASWVARHGGEPSGAPWEVYLTDPSREPDPATWRTEIIQPYRPA